MLHDQDPAPKGVLGCMTCSVQQLLVLLLGHADRAGPAGSFHQNKVETFILAITPLVVEGRGTSHTALFKLTAVTVRSVG